MAREERIKSFEDLRRRQLGKPPAHSTLVPQAPIPQPSRAKPRRPPPTGLDRMRASFRVAPRPGTTTAAALELCRRAVVDLAEERCEARAPRGMRRHRAAAAWGTAASCRAARTKLDGADHWVVEIARDEANRYTTTRLTVSRDASDEGRVHVDVVDASSAPRLPFDAFPAETLARMAEDVVLLDGSRKVPHAPIVAESAADMAALAKLLLDDGRATPLVVASVPSEADDLARLDRRWAALARSLTGLAQVWVLPAERTFDLTDLVNRELSVFNGAWRVYNPGFRLGADRWDHPLFLAQRLTTSSDRALVRREIVEQVAVVRARSGAPSADVPTWADLAARGSRAPGGPLGRLRAIGRALIGRWRGGDDDPAPEDREPARDPAPAAPKAAVAAVDSPVGKRGERVARERRRADKALKRARRLERELARVKRRNERLDGQVRILGGDPDAKPPFPLAWSEFEAWCDDRLDGLALTPAARRELNGAEFEDVALVAHCLHWLATEYRKRRLSGGDAELLGRIPSIAGGVHNRPCGGDSFDCDWNGRRRRVDWHIKRGGNTRDPRRCLRIYYFWDEDRNRVVVASLPAHRRTAAT